MPGCPRPGLGREDQAVRGDGPGAARTVWLRPGRERAQQEKKAWAGTSGGPALRDT